MEHLEVMVIVPKELFQDQTFLLFKQRRNKFIPESHQHRLANISRARGRGIRVYWFFSSRQLGCEEGIVVILQNCCKNQLE